MSIDKYYFLISSLPDLSLEQKSAVDTETFLEQCRKALPESRYQQLSRVSLIPGWLAASEVESKWQAWETYLRNLLVWRRCHHSSCEFAYQWIRPESDVFPSIIRQVDEAVSEESPLEKERILDRLRWSRLDDLAVEHQFDFEGLALYRLRLLLTEKWRDHDIERGRAAFSELTEQLIEQAWQLRKTGTEE